MASSFVYLVISAGAPNDFPCCTRAAACTSSGTWHLAVFKVVLSIGAWREVEVPLPLSRDPGTRHTAHSRGRRIHLPHLFSSLCLLSLSTMMVILCADSAGVDLTQRRIAVHWT